MSIATANSDNKEEIKMFDLILVGDVQSGESDVRNTTRVFISLNKLVNTLN